MARKADATSKHKSRLSITQGPAINVNRFDRRNDFQIAESSGTQSLYGKGISTASGQ
jgi:hypothetical protein